MKGYVPIRGCMGRSGKSGPACKGRNSRVRHVHQDSAANAGAQGAPYEVRSLTLKRRSLNATHYWYIAL